MGATLYDLLSTTVRPHPTRSAKYLSEAARTAHSGFFMTIKFYALGGELFQ